MSSPQLVMQNEVYHPHYPQQNQQQTPNIATTAYGGIMNHQQMSYSSNDAFSQQHTHYPPQPQQQQLQQQPVSNASNEPQYMHSPVVTRNHAAATTTGSRGQEPVQPHSNGYHPENHESASTATQSQALPQPLAANRPSTIRYRSVSVNSAYSGATANNNTINSSGSNNGNKHQCQQCGVDVRAVAEQMETARRKLELLQEKVEVDQALLDQEQKNFKRRLHTVKLSVKKTQRDAALKERQRQLDWAELSKQTELATQQRIQRQQQEYETKLLEAETTAAKHAAEQVSAMEAMQEQVLSLQTQLEDATAATEESESLVRQLQCTIAKSESSSLRENAVQQQQDQIAELERDLEAKNMALESLEMQLLELERERDASCGLRGSGGRTVSSLPHLAVSSTAADAGGGTSLNRQLSDAQLQIATLQNRQTVSDQKLSQERIKYDDLRQKMEQMELAATVERDQNDNRLRLSKDLKEAKQELDKVKQREQESMQHSKQLEQKLVQLQQENEVLETRLEELTTVNATLQEEVELEKERANLAMVTAAGAQRAVQDSAVQLVDVLSGPSPTVVDLLTATHALENAATSNEPRKCVMEYEWLGPQWSGVYTGELSTISHNPDGDGTLRVDDGAVYNGQWRNGKPHGAGVWATIEGDLYCSNTWIDGEKHGPSVDVLCDGCVYRGNYEHGKRHGHGILTWPYGAHYTGQFENDKRNGQGVYVHADGRCYTGLYLDDRPHGYGVMKAVDGTVLYDGMWELGEFLGPQGT
jgi:hypothetical protein